MTTVHHLDDATLMRFASGDLDEAFAVVVAAHIALCERCRSALHHAESCGGHMLLSEQAEALDEGAFNRLRQRIAKSTIEVPGERARAHSAVPEPLRRYVGTSFDAVSWKSVAPGVKKYDISLSSSTAHKLYLLEIAAGKEVPEHGHGGAELTLVLTGAYRDKHGRFGPGDIADLDEDDQHQPKVDPGEPCICLVAAEALTKPKGFFARLLQPFVRI